VHGNLVVPGPGITANDTDPDGDILHIGSCGTVAHGTLNCNTQYSFFTYEPNNAYVGADSFTYQTCDGYGLCDTGTVHLDVRNTAPDAVDDNYTVHGHLFVAGPNALRENDTDAEGDPFSVVSYTPASHGTFSYSYQYGALTYEPNYGYTGSDTITYQICDNLGLCDSATATFNVVNNPPVAVADVDPNCKCRTFRFSATLGFYIRDWFEDPLSVGIEPGGFVYRINASWMEDFSGNGRF
jgi:hypothetical protein